MLLTMRLLLRVLLAIVLTAAATAEEDDFSRPLQPAVSLRRASGTLAPSVRETFENLSPAAPLFVDAATLYDISRPVFGSVRYLAGQTISARQRNRTGTPNLNRGPPRPKA